MFRFFAVFCLLTQVLARPVRPIRSTTNCNKQNLTEFIKSAKTLVSLEQEFNVTLRSTLEKLLNQEDGSSDVPTYNVCSAIRPFRTPESSSAMCSWTYECDYEQWRFPKYILHTQCDTHKYTYERQDETRERKDCQCRALNRSIKVLRFAGCDKTGYAEWKLEPYIVRVGCICV